MATTTTRPKATDYAGCRWIRKSCHTGTLVGLYEAEEAGIDPAGGRWALVCEQHHTILNMETRESAERVNGEHGPLAWCDDCRDNHERVLAIVTPKPKAPHQTLAIQPLCVDDVTWERNGRRPNPHNEDHCLICNQPVSSSHARHVHVIDGGGTITTDKEISDDPGDMYFLPIGPQCYRKHRALLAPFVEANS